MSEALAMARAAANKASASLAKTAALKWAADGGSAKTEALAKNKL
jgi:hypothetical protein